MGLHRGSKSRRTGRGSGPRCALCAFTSHRSRKGKSNYPEGPTKDQKVHGGLMLGGCILEIGAREVRGTTWRALSWAIRGYALGRYQDLYSVTGGRSSRGGRVPLIISDTETIVSTSFVST
jgi:hypothetical protein